MNPDDHLAKRRVTFDVIAELYARFRPGYPDQLFNDIVSLSAIPPNGDILEIGCGTGQATRPLAERGFRVTALEVGARLAAIARENLAGLQNVDIRVCAFEDWDGAPRSIDLIVAAQSFHFVEPTAGLAKSGALLRPGGALAIFANRPMRGDSSVDLDIQKAYARHAPELAQRNDTETPIEDHIARAGLSGTVVMATYPWLATYSADQYVGLMETQSPHRLLPAERRAALLGAIHDAVTRSGDSLSVNYVTRLVLARRNDG